ncbi:MAG: nucleotidyltransferase domain-containing protein [Nitrospirae bacterium]|nr:nucleotidyltransferase domain-containing protein [Nitrospirota bacterium]
MAKKNDKTIEAVKKFLQLLKQQGIKIDQAYLYGSFAKNKATSWSDIDIALVSRDFKESRFIERIRLMKIASKIDKRIEPIPFRPEDFNDNDPLVWEIKNKGIIIS